MNCEEDIFRRKWEDDGFKIWTMLHLFIVNLSFILIGNVKRDWLFLLYHWWSWTRNFQCGLLYLQKSKMKTKTTSKYLMRLAHERQVLCTMRDCFQELHFDQVIKNEIKWKCTQPTYYFISTKSWTWQSHHNSKSQSSKKS